MLTQSRLKEVLDYCPETGAFKWKVSTSNRSPVGSRAGSRDPRGYIRIAIDGKCYWAHRLAWLCVTGTVPDAGVDHINGMRGDNAFSNLRPATQAQNLRNRGRQSNNTSGFKGVTANHNKWMAQIHLGYTRHYLGNFDTPEDAHAAYSDAALKLHGDFARVA